MTPFFFVSDLNGHATRAGQQWDESGRDLGQDDASPEGHGRR